MLFKIISTVFGRFIDLEPFGRHDQVNAFGLDNLNDDVIGCLTDPSGISVVQPSVLRDRMGRDINLLRNEMGLKPEEFNNFLLPVFEGFIRYADLLPASQTKHHSTTGGLLFHSFDVAKRAMRAAHCTQFPIGLGTLSDTQQSNKQWRVATVLAALLHDGGKILADMIVSNGENGEGRLVWDAHGKMSIHEWAARNNIERYYVSWQRERYQKHQNASLMVMQKLIPQQTWSWIDACYDGKQIHAAMLNAVVKSSIDHPMTNIVAQTDSDSVTHDMFHRTTHISKEVTQVPISDLLANLIKHYILKGKWDVNKKNAPVWYVNNALYLVWNNAANELVQEIRGVGKKIPESPDLLASIMIEDGLAHKNGKDLYFHIYPEILGDAKKPVKITALKVRNTQAFVLEEELLYSIREHPKKQPEKTHKTIGKPVVQLDESIESDPIQAPKPIVSPETSFGTLARVLTQMKKKKQPAELNDKAPLVPSSSSETGDENVYEEDASKEDANSMFESASSKFDSQPENVVEPTVQQGNEEQSENQIFPTFAFRDTSEEMIDNKPSQPTEGSIGLSQSGEIIDFILKEFDFPFEHGQVTMNESDVGIVAEKLLEHGFNGLTPFNVELEIRRLHEVKMNG